jgi:hypothetical protein
VNFSVTARSNAQLQSALYTVSTRGELWQPSRTQRGELREGAAVCEVTDYLNFRTMPSGTRCIVRREPLHPGAQRSLFASDEFRYWGSYTDCDGDPVELELTMRAHAHVEDHTQRLKESGLTRFPFTNLEANADWPMTVAMTGDLVRWFQLLCLDGSWKDARPKALRWEIFHAPGRIVRGARRVVARLLDGWPTARQLLNAYERIVLLTRLDPRSSERDPRGISAASMDPSSHFAWSKSAPRTPSASHRDPVSVQRVQPPENGVGRRSAGPS